MIVNAQTQDIVNETGLEKRGFAIKANAKAFDLLFNSLYSDPLAAMIREVAANAADAHIAAGCPEKAITVHIPNALEPWFVFKDEGVGMSDETVSNVFTTVFESTKDNSNSETGGFGLGCKTPYAMGDNFTVVSVKDGIRNEYLMYRDEARNPAYLQTSSTKTEEPNGTTVTVPYNKSQGEFEEIRRKAVRILSMFSCPINVNFEGLKPYKDGLIDIGDGVYYDNGNSHRSSNSMINVVMANICYPVDTRELGDRYYYMFGRMMYINIDNGSVDLTPSREALQYTPRTVKNLKEVLEKTVKTAKKYIAEKMKGKWEERYNAYHAMCELLRQNGNDHEMQKHYYIQTPKDKDKAKKFSDYYNRNCHPSQNLCDKKEPYTFILDDYTDADHTQPPRNYLNRARDYVSQHKGQNLGSYVIYVKDISALEELSAEAYDGNKNHLKALSLKEIVAEAEILRKAELEKKRLERKAKYKTGGILACDSLKGTITEISVSDLTEKHLMIDVDRTINAERANGMLHDRYDQMLRYAYEQGYTVCIARLKDTRTKTADHPKLNSLYDPALDALIKKYPNLGLMQQISESVYYNRRKYLGKKDAKANQVYDTSLLHKFEIEYLEELIRKYDEKELVKQYNEVPELFKNDVIEKTKCKKFEQLMGICSSDPTYGITNYMPYQAAIFFLEDEH